MINLLAINNRVMCVCGGAVRERVIKREFEEALKRARLEWGLGGEATGRLGASEVQGRMPTCPQGPGQKALHQ